MAVKLPSDLIVDVMRQADPARQRAAAAKLESLAGPADQAFAGLLDAAGEASPGPVPASPRAASLAMAGPSQQTNGSAEAYLGFERMVLRNMFETLLPKEDSGAFGDGPSSGIWRSMAADQLAGVYAKSGGIGIAGTLAAAQQKDAPVQQAQWPYFTLGKISSFTG